MENTMELDVRRHETERQTPDFWQNSQHDADGAQQVEDEAFAAQIETYEAWQAAIWLY